VTEVIPLERAIVGRITRWLTAEGHWWMKTQPPNRQGVPDLLVCVRGKFLGLEVKRPTVGVVGDAQKWEGGRIRDAGGAYHVVTTLEEAQSHVAELR
jgi:hypothetical protein